MTSFIVILFQSNSIALDNEYSGVVLHCTDLRTHVMSDDSYQKRSNSYKVEVGLQTKPETKFEYGKWGYFPHGKSDWDNTSKSHIEQMFPLQVTEDSNETLELSRISNYSDRKYIVRLTVNRKSGAFHFIRASYNHDGSFIKLDGIPGIASHKGYCKVEEKSSKNLF